MINFRPMAASEFDAYRAYFVPDYALDLMANHRLAKDAAFAQASEDLAQAFPKGAQSINQQLLCILGPFELVVGYLWFEAQAEGQTAFVQDFHILPMFQGQGFAKAAMAAFDVLARDEGFAKIKLRVAPDNGVARHVYDGAGFWVSGIQMVKNLS